MVYNHIGMQRLEAISFLYFLFPKLKVGICFKENICVLYETMKLMRKILYLSMGIGIKDHRYTNQK